MIFSKSPQIRTSKFHEVVQQHPEGMVGSIAWVLLEINSLSSSKKIENPLRIYKVIAMSLAYYFLGHRIQV